MLALLVLLLGLAPARGAMDFWSETWAALERLDALEGVEAERLALELEKALEARMQGAAADSDEAFRRRVLTVHLARRRGVGALVPAPGAPEEMGPDEAWAAARVLAPGPTRSRAFLLALEGAEDAAVRLARQRAAFDAFVADEEAGRGQAARLLAAGLHADADAVWSAFCLEGIARRLGEYELADRTLAVLLDEPREPPLEPAERVGVLSRRAIVALGAGWLEAARDHLGAALAAGGLDAGQMLGLLALSERRLDRARRVFRTLLGPDPGGTAPETPWALRGWGLALLPPERP